LSVNEIQKLDKCGRKGQEPCETKVRQRDGWKSQGIGGAGPARKANSKKKEHSTSKNILRSRNAVRRVKGWKIAVLPQNGRVSLKRGKIVKVKSIIDSLTV